MSQKETIRAEITRKNIDYIVDVGISEDFFTIHVEEADTGSRWWGEFTAKAIEHLTNRTGNLKKFSVFTKMLIGALEGNTSSVQIDIASREQLGQMTGTKDKDENKKRADCRYFILSYLVEFDRINYPLTLKPDDDLSHLKDTVLQLRAELKELRSKSKQNPNDTMVNNLKVEVEALKEKNRVLEEVYGGKLSSDNEENRLLRMEFEKLKGEKEKIERHAEKLSNTIEQQAKNLDELKRQEKLGSPSDLALLKEALRSAQEDMREQQRKHEKELMKSQNKYNVLVGEFNELKDEIQNIVAENKSLKKEVDKLQEKLRKSGSTAQPKSSTPRGTPKLPTKSKGTFNPTEYVNEQKRKKEEAAQKRGRRLSSSGNTTLRSRSNSTDRPLPPRSRDSSVERDLGKSRTRTSSVDSTSSRKVTRSRDSSSERPAKTKSRSNSVERTRSTSTERTPTYLAMTHSAHSKMADKKSLPRTPGATRKLTKRNSSPSVMRTTKQTKQPEPDSDDLLNRQLKQLKERFRQKNQIYEEESDDDDEIIHKPRKKIGTTSILSKMETGRKSIYRETSEEESGSDSGQEDDDEGELKSKYELIQRILAKKR